MVLLIGCGGKYFMHIHDNVHNGVVGRLPQIVHAYS